MTSNNNKKSMKQLLIEAGAEFSDFLQKRQYKVASEQDLVDYIISSFKLNRKLRRVQKKRRKTGME